MRRLAIGMALLFSSGAAAQEVSASDAYVRRGQGWSFLGGETIGNGANLLEAQAGFPGISAGYLHGVSDRIDLGGVFTFNYAFEGSVNWLQPGIKVQGLVRLGLVDTGHFNLGLRFAPGPLFYFLPANGGRFGNVYYLPYVTVAGFALPVSLDFGIPVASAINLAFSVEVPFFVLIGDNGGPVLPVLFGGGLEYFISRQLSLSFSTHMGPSIWASNQAYFTFEALFGIAYRL